MPVKPRKQLEIAQRRSHVADFYLQGWSQYDIADRLSCSQTTICHDLQAIRREWRDSRVRDFDEARAVELEKLDRLEREAWQAWQRSQEPSESTKVTDGGGGKRAEKVVKQQVGDVRFLEQVQKCISARRALLG